MNTSTQTFKVLQITTYDGDLYHIPITQKNNFLESLNSKRFIELHGEIVAVRTIKHVKPVNELCHGSLLSVEERNLLDAKIKSYKQNLGKKPSVAHIAKWSDMISNQESLTL